MIEKASPCSASARRGAGDDELGLGQVVRDDDAELVAAHPVGMSAARDELAEVLAEPREQRVARGMPERVVVVLEAVQVEEHEHEVGVRVAERVLEIVVEAAAVAEPGDDVGAGLLA